MFCRKYHVYSQRAITGPEGWCVVFFEHVINFKKNYVIISNTRQTALCVCVCFFSCQNNKQGIWSCSSGLNPCTRLFYLWVLLKDEVSINNPSTEEELKKSVRDVEPSVSPAEPRRALNRLYMTQVCGSKETFSSTFCMYTLA